MNVSFRVSVGGWSIDSAADPRAELLEADVRRSLGSPGDSCRLTLYAPPAPAPDLLGQAIAAASSALGLGGDDAGGPPAPSVSVRGTDVKHGDPVQVELSTNDVSATVMTAEIQSFESSLTTLALVGRTGAQRLADARLNQVYENQTTSGIASDIAQQAGVTVGDVVSGRTWPYLVIDESRSVWRHLAELAAREGADLSFDADNKLCLRPFEKTSPDHTLYYGIDILDLRLRRAAKSVEQVRVYGESPASNQGTSAWPWLVKDLAPLGGVVGSGARLRHRSDAAVRTKDAADGDASARLGAADDATAHGRLALLGRPDIKPGDAVEVKGAPPAELNGLFKVTSVRHRVSKRAGFSTVVDISGQGGAAKAGDLLGALGGALSGALGI